ncbi:hypothetical protein [Aeromicrobium flavum]|nr:hypothetical protein [Aeromicrobium flavum]
MLLDASSAEPEVWSAPEQPPRPTTETIAVAMRAVKRERRR